MGGHDDQAVGDHVEGATGAMWFKVCSRTEREVGICAVMLCQTSGYCGRRRRMTDKLSFLVALADT